MRDIDKFIETLSKEKIEEINKKQLEETQKQYKEFKEEFAKNKCYICGNNLNFFDVNKPCVHWLLNPKGFRKKYFKLIYQNFDYSNIDSYIKWVANQDSFAKNINNLPEEKKEGRIFEYTIKYKNLEWSFSCTQNDFLGHKNRRVGTIPHYHLQMKDGTQTIISFGDFHVPLNEHDLFLIKTRLGQTKNSISIELYGAGMGDLFQSLTPEEILTNSKFTDDEEKSNIHTSYILEAEPGKTISGEDVWKAMQKRKETGDTLWNHLSEIKNLSTKKAIISPGEGVPEILHRKGRGKKEDDKKQ